MPHPVKVILITDGDPYAARVVQLIAYKLNLRCILASAGNPTPLSGAELVKLLKQTPYDPVLVMFDDRGNPGKGKGEAALEYVASHPDISVIGALAVASNVDGIHGVQTDFCINRGGRIVPFPVDKDGRIYARGDQLPVVYGDTVDILNSLEIPIIIGLGDIGKMGRADDIRIGAPVTEKAIREILKRSGVRDG